MTANQLTAENWMVVAGVSGIPSPALLIYPDRVEENIRRMIETAGSPERLRPHVKTHKMSALVRLQKQYGITRFKCATLAEASMSAQSGGRDILLAMQPVGPHIVQFFNLRLQFPDIRFSAITDSYEAALAVSARASVTGKPARLWLDINNGMNRTGIIPGKALELYLALSRLPHIQLCGLHIYDGHIHETDVNERAAAVERDYEPVKKLVHSILTAGLPYPEIVAGGTPSFSIHAKREGVELSPGTTLLWDAGYRQRFPDLEYLQAAVLITRVVSKPNENLLCLDLGHKAVAAEMQPPRVRLIGLAESKFVSHSEEHLVIETSRASQYNPGDVIYAIPWHICPTVPRYPSAYVVREGKITDNWKVDARDRLTEV
jgi:D-serine deaminase-like pyridoxal phosphate-dependent protein